jgi:hypothetical protein
MDIKTKVVYLEKFANAHIGKILILILIVMGESNSHFLIELLPHIIYMIETIPKDVPILYKKNNYVDIFLNYLNDIGFVDKKRFIPTVRGNIYFGKEIYISSEW